MPTDLRDRVSTLIDETGRIERESEDVYLGLGRLFPKLSSELQKSADLGERSLNALSDLQTTGRGGASAAGGATSIQEASRFFGSLRERDSSFLERINEAISRLDALEAIIARVRADSEEMEIISLNAMTVALKSGAQGKAFSVITDELKRLSGNTIALTDGVTASGRSLLDFFAKLRSGLSDLDGFQRGFFEAIDKTLGSGYAELRLQLSGAVAFFSDLLGEARSVRGPVLRVMGEIQLQDIVRQSLQHVGLSLEEARDAGSADPSAAAFLASVAELAGSLIEETIAKVDASASAFERDIGAVNQIVSECERKRREFRGRESGTGTCFDQSDVQLGSQRYLGLKREVVVLASRLTERVGALNASFKGLVSILSRFQNIVVASRIEVAKTKALAGVTTTVGGMIDLTGRIEDDVEAAMDTTKDFTKLASQALGGYSAEGKAGVEGAEGQRLVATLQMVEEDIGRLTRDKANLNCAIDDFSLYSKDFIGLIAGAGDELSKLRALAARLRSVGAGLAELKSFLKAEGSEPGVVESDRLKRMMERFTIFTHKKAAGEIGRFEVEEGREAGEVTLF